MSTNPTTNATSIKDRPILRSTLVMLWTAIAFYSVAVLAASLFAPLASVLNTPVYQAVLGLSSYLLNGFEIGVDLLLIMGFWIIGGIIFVRRSDDWLAILTSLFLITFGVRITNLAHYIAETPGLAVHAGLIMALGDIGIVTFMMLFPTGRFAPRWLGFSIPVLVITMLALYVFPSSPMYWGRMNSGVYMGITTFWYLLAFASCLYRYFRQADLPQKVQIRWVLLGALGPFGWYILFQSLWILFPALTTNSLAATIVDVIARLLSIILFLLLPLAIVISIARYKSFDINLLINRSIVYGVLTTGLVLAFTAVLGLVSLVFRNFHQGDQSLLAVTVSAAAAGALFQPARRKLQRFIDRFFYKIRIDYQKTPAERRAEAATSVTPITPALSEYRSLKLIGRGGMAEVYCGEDPTTGQAIAVKVLLANLAGDEQFRRRFVREAEAITRLDHPNIVRILNYGDENGVYYIAMEYLSGPALNELLKEQKRLALTEGLTLLREVAAALDYAHQKGLVHRDIKPSNVVLDTNLRRRAVLTDFGIAKIADAHTRLTATNIVGSFDYIAPEQIQADPDLDGRADIYALGVMAFQLLTGQLPFKRPDTGALLLAHLTAPPPDPRDLLPDLPRNSARAILKAMAKRPDERFATAQEFVDALAES